MHAYGDALAGTLQKPLAVFRQHVARLEGLGRPATEDDPALQGGEGYKVGPRVRNIVETTAIGLSGVRSAVVRIPPVMHSDTDTAGFVPALIGLARKRVSSGLQAEAKTVGRQCMRAILPPSSVWLWKTVPPAAHGTPSPTREFRSAKLPKPSAAASIFRLSASRKMFLMLPGYFGFLANLVTLHLPASSLIMRQKLGRQPRQASLLEDLEKGQYFPAA